MKAILGCLSVILIIVAVFFSPVFLKNKVPLNANFLVSFYYPYRFEKFPGYPAGVPAKQGGGYDTIRIGFPYLAQASREWKNFKLPLWNPYNFSGLPLAAETQTAAYYPLYVFSFFLSEINLWTLFTVSGFFLCFVLTFFYLKNLIKSGSASVFGAFSYAFSTFFIVWNQEVVTCIHTAAWLPFILLGIDILEKNRKKGFLIILIGSVLTLLAAYTQVALYVLIFSFFYAVWRKKIVLFLFPVFLSVLLTLFQYLPLYEMYKLSSRTFIDMKPLLISYLLPYYSLIQLFIPEFFGNSGTWNHYGFKAGTFYEHSFATALPAVILAIYAVFSEKNKDRHFFLLMFLITIVSALNFPLSGLIFYSKIPVLSSSIANRILFLPAFSIAVLSSLGIKDFYQKQKLSRIIFVLFISLIFFGIGPLWALSTKLGIVKFSVAFPADWTKIALRNSVIPFAVLVFTFFALIFAQIRPKFKRLAVYFVFLLAVFQIFYFFQKTTAFSPREFVYPNHPVFDYLKKNSGLYRMVSYGSAFVENNLATEFNIYSPEGYDSLSNSRYAQLLNASQTNGKWSNNISRSDAGIDKGNEELGFDDSPIRLRLLELTSAKYILYRPMIEYSNERLKANDTPPVGQEFRMLAKASDTDIYEYTKVLEKATLVPKITQLTDNQAIFDKLFSPGFDPRKEIILEEKIDFKTNPDSQAKAEITNYQNNKLVAETSSKTNQWLLLTDSYYPGWQAYVDTKPTKIYRANFALRAVPVPFGNHTVILRYQPDSFKYGLIISGITLLAVIVFLKPFFKIL